MHEHSRADDAPTTWKDLTARLLGIAEKQGVVAFLALMGFLFTAGVVYLSLDKMTATLLAHAEATQRAIERRAEENKDMQSLQKATLRVNIVSCKLLAKGSTAEMEKCVDAAVMDAASR